jgi:anti-anti-sigma factor
MEIAVSTTQGRVPITLLQPHGKLDASTYKALLAKAQELFQAGSRDMLIDLSAVDYMSSAGLVALHTIALLLRGEEMPDVEAGWQTLKSIDRDRGAGMQPHFKLLSPQPRVERVLEMAGFTEFIEIFSDPQAAVAAF